MKCIFSLSKLKNKKLIIMRKDMKFSNNKNKGKHDLWYASRHWKRHNQLG